MAITDVKAVTKATCNVPGCGKLAFSRGLCHKHDYWRRSPHAEKRAIAERHLNPPGRGCAGAARARGKAGKPLTPAKSPEVSSKGQSARATGGRRVQLAADLAQLLEGLGVGTVATADGVMFVDPAGMKAIRTYTDGRAPTRLAIVPAGDVAKGA